LINRSKKIIDSAELDSFCKKLKSSGQKIVFTNGCFDLLHPGHIIYLAEAKKQGDCLIIGLNSDQSVARLKGSKRPINRFLDRATMLDALVSVDFIVGFEEDTPLNLITNIKPHVIVKGGDYKKKEIVGASYVESYGGEVVIIEFEPGYSSSALIEKIKNN